MKGINKEGIKETKENRTKKNSGTMKRRLNSEKEKESLRKEVKEE